MAVHLQQTRSSLDSTYLTRYCKRAFLEVISKLATAVAVLQSSSIFFHERIKIYRPKEKKPQEQKKTSPNDTKVSRPANDFPL